MKTIPAIARRLIALVSVALFAFASHPCAWAQASADAAAPTNRSGNAVSRIREEGMQHSQVMQTLSYLTEVIGPRLTGSPSLKRANEWTRDKLTEWGLVNAHLEAWGPFGRGWSLKRYSGQIVEPYAVTLIGYPKAWSPGLEQPVVADVVYLEARTEADLDKYKGKLKGAIVLTGPVREVTPRFDPLALRMSETNLLRLANAGDPRMPEVRPGSGPARAGGPALFAGVNAEGMTNLVRLGGGTNAVGFGGGRGRRGGGLAVANDGTPGSTNATPGRVGGGGRRGGGGRGGAGFAGRLLGFLMDEGAAVAITPSTQGDGGTVFVAQASLPTVAGQGGGFGGNAPRVWSTNAPASPPQITLATEDYNRLVRMIQQGQTPKMAVDLQVQFHGDDLMAYNTIAEIPGTDLKDEIVMVGGHIDSWQAGTGATDNGAGVAACMEAVRIIKALDLKPRRTIRIGLWSGEEQGLMGSAAYVAQHFGYDTNTPPSVPLRSPRAASNEPSTDSASTTNAPVLQRVRTKEYQRFSAYFNVDNGAGKIRGIYLQGNDAVRPLFRKWLDPFADLGADTITISNTGGTDHQSFDRIGLPGFQFIQDPIDYWTRTHHSNEDVFDRVPPDDMKQAATILATFAYNAAMLDEKLPRKPTQ